MLLAVAAVSRADGAWRRGCEVAVAVVAAARQRDDSEVSAAVAVASVNGLVHRSPGMEGPQTQMLGGASHRRCRGFGPWHRDCGRRADGTWKPAVTGCPKGGSAPVFVGRTTCRVDVDCCERVKQEKKKCSAGRGLGQHMTGNGRGQTRLTIGTGNA